jgi:hypothetical protein
MTPYFPVLYVWNKDLQVWVYHANSLVGAAKEYRYYFTQSGIPTLWIKQWPYSDIPESMPILYGKT